MKQYTITSYSMLCTIDYGIVQQYLACNKIPKKNVSELIFLFIYSVPEYVNVSEWISFSENFYLIKGFTY